MKRMVLSTILACVALTMCATAVSGQAVEQIKVELSETQSLPGVIIEGRAYVALSELSRAISGQDALARNFKIDGDTVSVLADGSTAGKSEDGDKGGKVGPGDKSCPKCMLSFGGEGVLSTKLLRVKDKVGTERFLVPLDDLAKAMGGDVKSDVANRMFRVMGVGGAAGEAGACKKCLIIFIPQPMAAYPSGSKP